MIRYKKKGGFLWRLKLANLLKRQMVDILNTIQDIRNFQSQKEDIVICACIVVFLHILNVENGVVMKGITRKTEMKNLGLFLRKKHMFLYEKLNSERR